MADPSRPVSSPAPVVARSDERSLAGIVLLILELALCVRIAAAVAIELYLRHEALGRLCLFDDTKIYWGLAREIRLGAPLVYIEFADIPHFALRTPGYPLFLAMCQAVFGESTLGVRLVQAVLGVLCVYLVYRLAGQFAGSAAALEPRLRFFSGSMAAAAIAALSPYYVFMSTILLSEALFEPLMLATLLSWTVLWKSPAEAPFAAGWRRSLLAMASGAAAGAAVLVRPSWALFVPAALGTWAAAADWRKREAASAVGLSALGFVMVMAPWWIRNARIFGRFVATALWLGASLYDGLNTQATGGSEMSFLADPAISRLDEQDQDAELAHRAIAFARAPDASARVRSGQTGSLLVSLASCSRNGLSWRGLGQHDRVCAGLWLDCGRGVESAPRPPRACAARGTAHLFLCVACHLRQLDALQGSRRDARAGTLGHRLGSIAEPIATARLLIACPAAVR